MFDYYITDSLSLFLAALVEEGEEEEARCMKEKLRGERIFPWRERERERGLLSLVHVPPVAARRAKEREHTQCAAVDAEAVGPCCFDVELCCKRTTV